jgi:hypothetical protein
MFFASGVGLFAYLAAWIIIPKPPLDYIPEGKSFEYAAWHKYLPGLILIAIGVLILSGRFWSWMNFDNFWPALLIIAGVVMIFMKNQKNNSSERYL